MNSTPDALLRTRLISFILELNVDPGLKLQEGTPLLRSGLFDSAATLQLAEWIQGEVGSGVDLLQFDLSKEWDTIADIESFIRRHQRPEVR